MKSIVLVTLASLLLVSSVFAYEPPCDAPPPPDVSGLARLSEGLAKATLWSWILGFAPETLDCLWLCWAFAKVDETLKSALPQSAPSSPIKDYPPRLVLEPDLP